MAENVNYTIVTGSDALPGTYREYVGIMDSEPPTGCAPFSLFFDVAENKVYFYGGEEDGWIPVGSEGDGGGGGGGGGISDIT